MSVYYYVSVNIITKAAKELGENDDYNKYNQLKEKIYNAILTEFFSPNGRLTVNTQTGYVLSLYYNIYRNKESIINGFIEKLRMDAHKPKTGFTGTPLILLALFDNGLDSEAYQFFYNQKFPGWIYAINLGATTIWERWNSLLPNGTISGISMNSFNHYAYGSVCEAIYSRIAGLKNLSPGWKKVLIEPHLNYRLKKINFSYNSISGKYHISWKYDEFKFYMNITIPNGAQALVILPNKTEYNISQGDHYFESAINEKIIAPFSIDTPLFELLQNEDANKLISQLLPAVYYQATGENREMLYGSIRLMSKTPFFGITQEVMDKCQDELGKIKVINYTMPDDPTDTPIDPTDDPTDHTDSDDHKGKSNFMKFNSLILCLIILFWF